MKLMKFEIVLIKTNQATNLTIRKKNSKLLYSYKVFANHGEEINQNQHLYILSDEKIKEGDEMYHPFQPYTIKATNQNKGIWSDCKKIIASTDSIITPYNQIPESFIKYYIEEYNKGNQITEVEMEMESKGIWQYSVSSGAIKFDGRECINCGTWKYRKFEKECNCGFQPLTENGFVKIITKKRLYTSEEVKEILENCLFTQAVDPDFDMDKWIKENF